MLYIVLTVNNLINKKLGEFCRFEENSEKRLFYMIIQKNL